MMTTRNLGLRPRPPRPSGEKVTVEVAEPHAVYWDGEQRSGTLTDVPIELANHWLRHGWVSFYFEEPEPVAAAESKAKKSPGTTK